MSELPSTEVQRLGDPVTYAQRPNLDLPPCPLCSSTALGPYRVAWPTARSIAVKCCDCDFRVGAETVDQAVALWTDRRVDTVLRRLLWLRHGCPSEALDATAGEMRCEACQVDFRRDIPATIEWMFLQVHRHYLADPHVGGLVARMLAGGVTTATDLNCAKPSWLVELEGLRRVNADLVQKSITASSAFQGDVAALLVALGLGNHARDASPHEVVRREVLPAIEALVARR